MIRASLGRFALSKYLDMFVAVFLACLLLMVPENAPSELRGKADKLKKSNRYITDQL